MKNSQRTSNKKVREDLLLTETESLKKYIEKLEKNNETDKNAKKQKTKRQSTVSPTTKWRYLKDLKVKARAQKALWFLRAYGLKLNNCEVGETNSTCTTHNFNIDDPSSTFPITKGTSKYSTPTENDKKKLDEVLFLTDRFSASEEFTIN